MHFRLVNDSVAVSVHFDGQNPQTFLRLLGVELVELLRLFLRPQNGLVVPVGVMLATLGVTFILQ